MRILVLGAYGLIGSAVTSTLLQAGHEVTGLGRSVASARRRWPKAAFVERDLRRLAHADDWKPLLAGFDAVVNAAGVLQDGADDDVLAVQTTAMEAMFAACAACGPARIVQISAVGASMDAPTVFMTSKARADQALRGSGLDWIILRPGLVLGGSAYGASALLRALASFPFVVPLAAGASVVQTVGLDELADAVRNAVEGRVGSRVTFDLVEDERHGLGRVVLLMRDWLGFPPARTIAMPRGLAAALSRGGDWLGRLGWRPALRTTALRQIETSVTGDPSAWKAATGRGLSSLETTLQHIPGSVQERWFARMWLLKPVVVGTLAAFWIASGLIAVASLDRAAVLLTSRGVPSGLADATVLGGAALDVALGIGALVRATTRPAALGMIATALGYLLAGTLIAPDLWSDPLGPYIKVLPGVMLALVWLAIEGDR